MEIIYDSLVNDYLSDLIGILYEKEYFGFLENAEEYVDKLVYKFEDEFILKRKKNAPSKFDRYGKNLKYVSIQMNRRTTWYFMYMQKDDRVLVSYITNNHVKGHCLSGLR